MKIFLILISLLAVSACCHKPTRIITNTQIEYKIIPDEYFSKECKEPYILTDEEIAAIIMEEQYNKNVVLDYVNISRACYSTVERIKNFNEENKNLNKENS